MPFSLDRTEKKAGEEVGGAGRWQQSQGYREIDMREREKESKREREREKEKGEREDKKKKEKKKKKKKKKGKENAAISKTIVGS